MSSALTEAATKIAGRLAALDTERRRIGRQGLATLKRLDPETAALVKDLWEDDEEHVVDWFINPVQSLRWQTPWQCIADGRSEDVRKILVKIAYGVPN